MVQILRNKNLATRFQILVEIAANQPNLQQKEIASKLDVTSQAISEYIKEMVKDGWLLSEGRARYRITQKGMNWVLQTYRELRDFSAFVGRAITNITICTAVAHDDLSKGQAVGLAMSDGLLYTTGDVSSGAKGIAVTAARKGDDVGVSNIEGIVDLVIGKVTILRVPGIQKGGSANVNLIKLKNEAIRKKVPIGAIGIEAITALRRLDIEPNYLYGVAEAAVEAARSGLSFIIVCTEDDAPSLLARLKEANLDYELLDLKKEY